MSRCLSIFLHLVTLAATQAASQTWTVPLGGNAYIVEGTAGRTERVHNGGITWRNPSSKFSVYVHIDRKAELDLALRLRVPQGKSIIQGDIAGKSFQLTAENAGFKELKLGKVKVNPGYQRLDITGLKKEGTVFAEISDLVVSTDSPGVKAAYIRDNQGNRFYWGRRGPSVHLNYRTPPGKQIAYAYTEVKVPAGQDPPGSFYMASGFGQGYFGIQTKTPKERWVLFSVWSPHHTNNPNEIPENKRVKLLKKGDKVRGGVFGGEGSGGQSILVYPWKSGVTYKFLLGVKPDGQGNTVYTAWFGEVGKPEWKLIASFKRPQINTWLTRYHSFLENFHNSNGYLERGAYFGNQWVRDTTGTWHEVTSARFTGDATANSGQRLDYAGGVHKNGFFLRNGGYFNQRVPTNRNFTRPSTAAKKPDINFEKLGGP